MVTSDPTECLEGWYTEASPRTVPRPASKEECMQQILTEYPLKKASAYTHDDVMHVRNKLLLYVIM